MAKNNKKRRRRVRRVETTTRTPKPVPSTVSPSAVPAPLRQEPGAHPLPWPLPGQLRHPVLAGALLCLLVAACFYPAALAGFVWDDAVLEGALPIRDPAGLWQIWFTPRVLSNYEGHYWPILYTTFWLEHKLWGLDPVGFHIVNVLLHGAVTLFLWRLLLLLAVPGAWLVAALFAVHPVHVESVVWVIGRKDIMATLFLFCAMVAYMRYDQQRRWGFYVAALACFVLGLFSKSIAMVLPVALLLWHWWKQGHISMAQVGRVLPFLALGAAIMLADVSYYKDRDPTSFDHSLPERVLLAGRTLYFYTAKLIWPSQLSVIYPRWELRSDDLVAWAQLGAVLAGLALLWFGRHRIGRGPLVGVLFFAATLAPSLGFVDYGYMRYSFVADRYQYLAGIGLLCTLIGGALFLLRSRPELWRRGGQVALVVCSAVALGVLGAITWKQTWIYRDNFTFYSHIISLNPTARFAHHSLGQELHKQGRYEEALASFHTDYELAQKQNYPDIRISKYHISSGRTLEKMGRIEEAGSHYRRAVKASPRYNDALENWGGFLLNQKRPQEALEVFQALTQMSPTNPRFHVGLGVALAGLKRYEEALRSYDRALALHPSLEMALQNRASVLRHLGRRR